MKYFGESNQNHIGRKNKGATKNLPLCLCVLFKTFIYYQRMFPLREL